MHGYSYLEILTALAIVSVLALVISTFANPAWHLRREYDAVREDGVRDYMEALLDLQLEELDAFEPIFSEIEGQRAMIGTGESCAGGFGDQCSDEILSDTCLDLTDELIPIYLESLPIDPREGFSENQTGYYVSYVGGVFEVGACNPESRNEIILTKRFSWE